MNAAETGGGSSSARVRKHRLIKNLQAKRQRLEIPPTETSSSDSDTSCGSEHSSNSDADVSAEDTEPSRSLSPNPFVGYVNGGEVDNVCASDHELLDNADHNRSVEMNSNEVTDDPEGDSPSNGDNHDSDRESSDRPPSEIDSSNVDDGFDSSNEDSSGSSHRMSSSSDVDDGLDSSVDERDIPANETNSSLETDVQSEEDEVAKLKIWAIESRTPNKHVDSLLVILRQRLLPQLPKTAKTLLGITKAQYQIKVMTDSRNEEGGYVYIGVAEGLKTCVNIKLHPTGVIDVDINIDGVQIHKDSPMTMWPILCKVHHRPDIYKPFPVSVFYGNGKPQSFEEFLADFILEMNQLSEHGLVIQNTKFTIRIRIFSCDKPATDAIKATKGHSSFDGCGRCKVKGKKIDNVTVFLDLNCEKRTPEGFRNFEDVCHHNGPSPLLALVPWLDLVYKFMIEPMHAIHLGVTPRLLSFLMKGAPNSPVQRLSAQQKIELNRRTKKIKVDIPHEFKRKMPSTDFFEEYHAVDNRFFLLYVAPLAFKKILTDAQYSNCLLLHLEIRMLSSPRAPQYTELARGFSHQFIEGAVILYGQVFVTVNVHPASHLPDDVDNTGCGLDEMSAFPYENELGKIKRILLSPHRTLVQYCRRLHVQRSIVQIPQLPKNLSILKETKTGKILQINDKQYFFSTKHPNNTALLDDGKVVKIQKFSKMANDLYAKVSYYRIKDSIFTQHYDSSQLNMYEVGENRNSLELFICIRRIASKMVKFNLNFSEDELDRIFVIPLIH